MLRRQGADSFDIAHEIATQDGGACMVCAKPYQSNGIGYYEPTCGCYSQHQRERYIDRILLASGAPSLYKTPWRQTKYEREVDKVNDYILERRYMHQWLVILGTPGTGKTRKAVNVMRDAVYFNLPVSFIPMVQLIKRIIAGEEIRTKGLVVLDDFDKVGSASEWTRAQIHDLVDQVRKSGVGVVTSNALSVGELRKKYGDAISSRILQDALIVKFIGVDMRVGVEYDG